MKRTLVFIGILCIVLLGLWAVQPLFLSQKKTAPKAHSPLAERNTEAGCPSDGAFVCGVDGATYQNSCSAERADVHVVHTGACQSPSSLSADERARLLWLLRARIGAKMPEVPIRFERAEKGACDFCFTYYYMWGDPEVRARLVVSEAIVESAVDSTGYDYVAQKQGSPLVIN